jgi:hypothetical protein
MIDADQGDEVEGLATVAGFINECHFSSAFIVIM